MSDITMTEQDQDILTADEVYTSNDTDVSNDTSKLTFPSDDQLDAFEAMLQEKAEKKEHGYVSALVMFKSYRYHKKGLAEQTEALNVFIARQNGELPPRMKGGSTERTKIAGEKRSLRVTAEKFYGAMSLDDMKRHCAILDINPDMYTSGDDETNIEDLHHALVEAHVQRYTPVVQV